MDAQGATARLAGHASTLSARVSRGADPAASWKTAQDFEAMYLGQMLQPMFEELTAEAPFGGGLAEEFWRSFEVEEFSKGVTRAGGVGIATSVYRQLMARQEQGGIRA